MNRVEKFVEKFAESLTDQPLSVDRLVTESSNLSPEEMMTALSHPAVGRAGIDLMADFMHPTDSRYFDAIYGSYYGQKNIRGWLVPMMSEISFIEFVPTSEPEFFDDGEGVTTLDEWQMVADMQAMGMGEGKMPMSRGVSVRRYRDSWITWACDVYDTGSFRVPPPPGVEAAPLPDAPSPKEWQRHLATPVTVCSEVDFDADCEQFHPTDSVYHDPIFGVFHGRDEIKSWIMDIMPRVGNIEFMPVGPELNNGKTYLQEWVQVAVTSDGERVPMFRGTSVRRYRDGFTVYAADYFDTASLMDPEVMAASAKCGSSLTAPDIMKYKLRDL